MSSSHPDRSDIDGHSRRLGKRKAESESVGEEFDGAARPRSAKRSASRGGTLEGAATHRSGSLLEGDTPTIGHLYNAPGCKFFGNVLFLGHNTENLQLNVAPLWFYLCRKQFPHEMKEESQALILEIRLFEKIFLLTLPHSICIPTPHVNIRWLAYLASLLCYLLPSDPPASPLCYLLPSDPPPAIQARLTLVFILKLTR
jgi:hypothetical protein